VKTFKQLSFLALAAIIVPMLAAEQRCPGNVAGLPFRLIHRSQIIAPVMINRTGPYDFLVDTGAEITMIDLSLAAELQLKSKDEARVLAVGFQTRASISQLEMIEVGLHAIANHQVGIRKLDYSLGPDMHIRGILGANFLGRFDVLIDNAHQMLCLDGTKVMQVAMKGKHIALVTPPPPDGGGSPGSLLLPVHLSSAGSNPLLLKLDSGSNAPFLYDPDKYLNVGLSGNRLLHGQNLDGTVRTFALLSSQEMRIGNILFPQITFSTLLGTNRDVYKGKADGLLPTGLFRSVYIGYADRFVVLVPW
jgi:gag-polyprotein putative aspartyl protease